WKVRTWHHLGVESAGDLVKIPPRRDLECASLYVGKHASADDFRQPAPVARVNHSVTLDRASGEGGFPPMIRKTIVLLAGMLVTLTFINGPSLRLEPGVHREGEAVPAIPLSQLKMFLKDMRVMDSNAVSSA